MKWNPSGVRVALVLAALLSFGGCAFKSNITGPGTPPTGGKTDGNLAISFKFPEETAIGSPVYINGTLDPAYDLTNTEARHVIGTVGNDGKLVPVSISVKFNYAYTAALFYQNTDGTWSRSLDFTINGVKVTERNVFPNALYGVVRIDSNGNLSQYRDDTAKLTTMTLTYDGMDPLHPEHPEVVGAADSIYFRNSWTWPDDLPMSWNGSAKTATITVSKGDTGWVAIRDVNHAERVANVKLGGVVLAHWIWLSQDYRVAQYFVDTNGNVTQLPADTRWGTITLHTPRSTGKAVPVRRAS